MIKDITKQIQFGEPDRELLPIEKCACGKEFDYWDFTLCENKPIECSNCHRKMYFIYNIRVYEVDGKELYEKCQDSFKKRLEKKVVRR